MANSAATAYVTLLPTVSKSGMTAASNELKANLTKINSVITTAVVGGVSAIVTGAVKNFAKFEQFQGGIEKIFGKKAAKSVKTSQREFAKLGFSMNEAQETILSFASSLKKSGGKMNDANTILTDMADNASIFGTDIESLQNAYAGFAKQQYNMLDNLKLGYGSSQTEMKKLLEDAEKLTGVKYDITNFNDVASAIHEIQEAQNIAGNAAKEAQNTISGAWETVKADFDNVLTALGTEDGINKEIDYLIEDLENLANIALPAVSRSAKGLFDILWNEDSGLGKIAVILGGVSVGGSILGNLTKIGNFLKPLGTAFVAAFSALSGEALAAIGTLGLVIATFGYLLYSAETFATGAEQSFGGFLNYLVTDFIPDSGKFLMDGFAKIWDGIVLSFQTVWDGIEYAFWGMISGILNGAVYMVNAIIDTLNKIPGISIGKLDYFDNAAGGKTEEHINPNTVPGGTTMSPINPQERSPWSGTGGLLQNMNVSIYDADNSLLGTMRGIAGAEINKTRIKGGYY